MQNGLLSERLAISLNGLSTILISVGMVVKHMSRGGVVEVFLDMRVQIINYYKFLKSR